MKSLLRHFSVASVLFILIAVTHRGCCSSVRRQERRARHEERRRRRAYERAAHKHAWRSWFTRHFRRSLKQDEDADKNAMLNAELKEGEADDMASEIHEFRNAVDVVGDIVAAEEGRASMDSRSSLPDYMSQLGGEVLPTYEDSDGSGMSSFVADGFQYTPGSTNDSPGISEGGSVRNIIGDADVKE
jgi:hypothetical protein